MTVSSWTHTLFNVLCAIAHALHLDSLLTGCVTLVGWLFLLLCSCPLTSRAGVNLSPKAVCLSVEIVFKRAGSLSGQQVLCIFWISVSSMDTICPWFFYSFSFKTPWLCQHLPLTVQIRKFLLFPLQTHGRKKSSCAQPSSASPAQVTAQRPVSLYPTKPIS